MLPTPLARDWRAAGSTTRPPTSRIAGSLPDAVIRLLPTPMRADDHGASPVAERRRYRRQVTLRDIASDFPLPPADQPEPRLLPTPAAGNPNDGEDTASWLARQARHRARRINGNGMGMPLSVAVRLLPTPLASEAHAGSPNQHDSAGRPGLTSTVLRLLPTPRASGNRNSRTAVTDHGSGPGLEQAIELVFGVSPTELAGTGEPPLSWAPPGSATESGPTGAGSVDWGDYGPAIRRWTATLDRPAPHPTEPGRTGRPRLAATFVEWLMGLDVGWVTGIGITRAAQIRTLGNGVIPAQAAMATTFLLADLVEETISVSGSGAIGGEDVAA